MNNYTDGSEDGQIVTPNSGELNFSFSEEEVEYDSSLSIKPPQLVTSRNERFHKIRERDKGRYHERKLREKRHRHKRNFVDPKHGERKYKDSVKDRTSIEKEKHTRSHERYTTKDEDCNCADRVLQDLRSRLLSKRRKQTQNIYRKEDKTKQSIPRENQKREIIFDRDVETEARKDRLLEAEREMARLKRSSRAELDARREMRKEAKSSFNCADISPADMKSPKLAKKRIRNSSLEDDVDTTIVTLSDDTEEDKKDCDEDSDAESCINCTGDESEHSVNDDNPFTIVDLHKFSRTSYEQKSPYRLLSVSPEPLQQHADVSKSPFPGAFPDDGIEVQQVQLGSDQISVEDQIKELSNYPPYYPGIQGCRSVAEFQCLNRIEEGTYGVVYRAKDLRTEEIVALKRLKMEKEKDGFPITSLREINTLLKAQHTNIVTVREIVVGSNMDKIFIVMDYVEHDLKSLMETMKRKKQGFLPGEVKCLLQQLLMAVAHLHDNWILHRDLKTSNLLLSHKGVLKVGDFGLAREYGSPLRPYTPVVVTLWYRSPELLLGCKEYSTAIDIWSVGCIFAELLSMSALFPGKSEVDQLNRIFKDLGTPNEKMWPGYKSLPAVQKMTFTDYPVSSLSRRFSSLSPRGLNLLNGFLTYDPGQRISAEEALKYPYLKEVPLPIDPAMFPTWPAKSELGSRRALASSPKPPSGGDQFKALGQGEDADDVVGFHWGSSKGVPLLESRNFAMGAGFSLKF